PLNTLGVLGNVTVGDAGNGTFTQTGGSHDVKGMLVLGSGIGSTGIYNLAGTAGLSAGTEVIGNRGTGVFNQTGGTNTIAGWLYIGSALSATGGAGTYNLLGGSARATSVYVGGSGGTGTLNVGDGGTLS